MGQLYSVFASSVEVHDTGQNISSTVELPVSTLNTEVEGNLNFLKKNYERLLFHHFLF